MNCFYCCGEEPCPFCDKPREPLARKSYQKEFPKKKPQKKPRFNFDKRSGRLIVVNGIKWKWRIGKGGGVVAYSEKGERRYDHGAYVKGINHKEFSRGQWKGHGDGAVTPSEIVRWLEFK